MRAFLIAVPIVAVLMGGCGPEICAIPDDPRVRADELIGGCFTGRTFCTGSGLSRIEGLESTNVSNWAEIQACGRNLSFDRVVETRFFVSVVYICTVEQLAIEYRVIFSSIDPPCESVEYVVYRRDEFERVERRDSRS